MNRLLTALLAMIFIFGGSGYFCLTLLIMILTGILPFDSTTLLLKNIVLTYHLYGLVGMCYIMLCFLSLVACFLTYWFDMSFKDLKVKLQELNDSTKDETTNTEKGPTEIEKKINKFLELKHNIITTVYDKVKFAEKYLIKLKSVCEYLSRIFDKICYMIYSLTCKVRMMTNNVVVFREIYYVYDQMCKFKKNIEMIKSMYCASQDALDDELVISDKDTNSKSKLDMKDSLGLFGDMGMDLDELKKEMNEMSSQYKSMTPEQKKEEANKAFDAIKNMFNNVNFDAMMNLDMSKFNKSDED